MTRLAVAGLTVVGLVLCGCAVGPNYKRPVVSAPPAYKEAEGWKPAEPSDAVQRKDWWKAFGDPVLDDLEAQVTVSNQTLAQSEAAWRQAKALLDQQRATLFPQVNLSGAGARSQSPSGFTSGASGAISLAATPINTYATSLGLTWDVDVWGRIRRSIEAAHATADASAGDLANATLSQQVMVAMDYFQLREADEEKQLIDETVKAYADNLRIFQGRFRAGAGARADVLSAETQLETAQAQAVDLVGTRAKLEHAIAVLVGKAPASFAIAPTPWTATLPQMPAAMPSALLERRPDIAAAERRVKAANAQIGVNVAGYFPDLQVSGQWGFTSIVLDQLFNTANNSWSIGGSATEAVFNAGATSARVRQARAAYDGAVANYRLTVLTAFQGVEDNIAALRVLESEYAIDQAASAKADEAEDLTRKQYKAGAVDSTAVIVAQNTALAARRTALQASRNRFVTLVDLIQAFGGGWSVQQLASASAKPAP
jgi:NodT family efflux transporter outer membrane factor (OMF) lipoprotein